MRPLTPQIAELLNLAVAQYRAGDRPRMRETCRTALALDCDQVDALHLLGISFLDERPAETERFIRQAIAAGSQDPLHHLNLGRALVAQSRFEQALGACDEALRRKPGFPEAHDVRGSTLRALGRLEEAVAAFGAVLAAKPDHIAALMQRGDTLFGLRRFDEAIADYDRILAILPGEAGVVNCRGRALLELGRPEEALAAFERAAAIGPDGPDLMNNRGCALKTLGRFDEALASFDRALALAPDYAEALSSRGSVLEQQGRFAAALDSYQAAQRVRPDYASAHWNEAIVRLRSGDFSRGFEKAEWRFRVASSNIVAPTLPKPIWRGDTPVEGKTIQVYADQGHGDAIQFARYIPLLTQRGARVVAFVQKPLCRLLATVEGVSACSNDLRELPDFDAYAPLGSLPLGFGTTLETIPASVPYLAAPALSPAWRDRLAAGKGPLVGLVWAGNPAHTNDRNRSVPFEMLRPLLRRDATFVSLQTEPRPGDATAMLAHGNLIDAGSSFADFSDTAALVAALDLVITVDTSVAHLAGALARPVWILLPHIPDWRWLLDREDSPWYPTARLFRQGSDRRWEPVIERIGEELTAGLGVRC